MEIVVVIIMIMVGFSFVLKLTCQPVIGILATCVVMAIFTGMMWDVAVNQSKAQISDWIENPELMLDISVVLTIDVFFQITFCVLSAKQLAGSIMKRSGRLLRVATLWIPGLLVFPTLFALLVEVIFAFPGVDFATLGWACALGVAVSALMLTFLIRWVLPEQDLRLELMFMVNALIAILGIIATVNGRTAVAGTNEVEWGALAGILAIMFSGGIAGLYIYNKKNSYKS